MTSTSSLGSTAITIQFDLNRSIDGAANDIQAAINAAGGQLPKNLPTPPTYRKVNPADSPILLLSATSDTLPLTAVSDGTDAQLAQQISQISGVAQVFIGGQQKPAIRIQIDPAKLVVKGLSLEDVRNQIAITTVDSPKGNIDGDTRSYTIYANDQLLESKDWNDVIIAYRNGGPLRIRDIGQAVSGPEDVKQAAWADGKRGVFLVIFKQPGANVIDTVDKIKAQLPRLIAALPPAIKIKIISDRTLTIRAAVEDVQFTLLVTIALVVMVIFIFLRSVWATIIPSVTVPLALLGACSLMWIFGYTLDNLSLMALTISVGFVVDDAIVMLENITRYIEEGETPLAAAFKGAGEIGFTILSISISLIAVLIPLLLMGGIIGRLFREFAVTLAMAIFLSLVVSLTLTPMMASRFLRAHKEIQHGRFYKWSERAYDAMLHAYERGLDRVLRWRLTTLCIFFATLGLSVYLFVIIPKGFFPQQDNGFLTATSEAAQDISFADMKRHQEELGEIVQHDPDVASIAMFIGGGGSALNTGRLYITLKPRNERSSNAQQIIARLRPQVEKVQGARLFMQASQDVRLSGRATRTQFEYTLQDASLNELNEWAPKTELLRLAQDWEHVKLQVIDCGDQERKMTVLALRAGKIAEQYDNIPDPIVWVGIITSEQATLANENGSPLKAFELAKRARDILEMVEKTDPMTMDAAAPTTLGLLYDRVPGFPMGFGDKAKARLYLQEAVRYAPNALDANYFYGDFLYRQGEQAEAINVFEHALTLPEISDRPMWDRSRRAEIRLTGECEIAACTNSV